MHCKTVCWKHPERCGQSAMTSLGHALATRDRRIYCPKCGIERGKAFFKRFRYFAKDICKTFPLRKPERKIQAKLRQAKTICNSFLLSFTVFVAFFFSRACSNVPQANQQWLKHKHLPGINYIYGVIAAEEGNGRVKFNILLPFLPKIFLRKKSCSSLLFLSLSERQVNRLAGDVGVVPVVPGHPNVTVFRKRDSSIFRSKSVSSSSSSPTFAQLLPAGVLDQPVVSPGLRRFP